MPEPTEKPRAVILGGGVGAMTAAFELSRDGWRDHFESITVYQLGWRLGGKGASGRGREDRIEEHGLHIWLGFYENAFRMMRDCYQERRGFSDEPFPSVDEAFEKASTFIVQELTDEGWIPWPATFPEDDQLPGDPNDDTPLPSTWEYLRRSIQLALRFLVSVLPERDDPAVVSAVRLSSPASDDSVDVRPGQAPRRSRRPRSFGEAWREATQETGRLLAVTLGQALELVDWIGEELLEEVSDHYGLIDGLLARAVGLAKDQLRELAFESEAGRRSWYLADILLACARGILRHDLLDHPEGFDAIDNFDFADWLQLNGADEESARCSLIKTVVYDIAFAYREGDCEQPSFSAAAALRGMFRWFFTYKGAIAWRMRAGMGDVVFAPLFQVLEKRGVEFRFFHRVDSLHIAPDGRSISSITISKQAELVDAVNGYQPLKSVGDLQCWPSAPLWDQLVDGERLRRERVNFESFWCQEPPTETFELDVRSAWVVLGIPVGALRYICSELVTANLEWRNMVTHLATVQTQSLQLWLKPSMNELAKLDERLPIFGGYVEPFDTCADMSHLIDQESVHPRPGTIAYFCNAMPTKGMPDPTKHGTPAKARREVRRAAHRFLEEDMVALWPGAVSRYPADFRWDLLVAPDALKGPVRLLSQFWKANVDPSERYVQSLPGTLRYRLYPGASGYDNLVLAGDWTQCGLNSGCVEAAVISGMLAANAIQQQPALDEIVGYDHP
jgi:uncharacterized protein with NAD-binding domain and iron-sulfur cluster